MQVPDNKDASSFRSKYSQRQSPARVLHNEPQNSVEKAWLKVLKPSTEVDYRLKKQTHQDLMRQIREMEQQIREKRRANEQLHSSIQINEAQFLR